MEELLKAVKSLVSDIEAMQKNYITGESWFGGFSNGFESSDDGNIMVEWPNLAISLAEVKKTLSETDPAWLAAELQRVRDRANQLETLLAKAVEDWPEFDLDDDVNGGDMVEWFGQFRQKAVELVGFEKLS